jgi:putative membrane protein
MQDQVSQTTGESVAPSSDTLALVRTRMANDRTGLAYIRTSLSLMASGGGLIKLFEAPVAIISGWLLVFAGVIVGIAGFRAYVRAHRIYKALKSPEIDDIRSRFS